MTSMDDPLFRTQDWAAQQRWMGQQAESSALANIGSEAGNTVRYLQDLQMRQHELDLRTQQWQVERQIQMQKLAEMQAIDQADGGRLQVNMLHEQVRQLKVHNDMAEHALEQSKQNVMTSTEEFLATHAQGFKEMMDLGIYVFDPAAPGGIRPAKDDAERKAAQAENLQREQDLYRARNEGKAQAGIGAQLHAVNERAKAILDYTTKELQSIEFPIGDSKYAKMSPEDKAKARDELEKKRNVALRLLNIGDEKETEGALKDTSDTEDDDKLKSIGRDMGIK